MERVAHYALVMALLCFFLSPLIPIHYFPWTSFYNEFVAALSLVFLLLYSVLMKRYLVFSLPVLVLLALAFVPLIQYVSGTIYFLGDALLAFSYLTGLALALALGQQLFSIYRQQFLVVLAYCFIGLAIICIYQALYQWFELAYLGLWIVELKPGNQPAANIAQANNLSTLLCLGLFSALYLWENNKLSNPISILLALFLLMGIVLVQSRTALVVGLVFSVWWLWKHKALSLRLAWPTVVAVPMIYMLLREGLQSLREALLLGQSLREVSAVMDAREAIWSELIQAVMDGPLWGYGWGQVAVAQATVNSSNTEVAYTQHSHNLLLDLLIWNGPLLGGLCVLLLAYWGLKHCWQTVTKEQWFALLLLASVLTHGMLEYPIEYAYFLFPLGLVAGVLITSERKVVRVTPGWQFLMFMIALVFVASIFREYRLLEEDHRKLRMEGLFVNAVRVPGFAPDVVLLTQLREFQRFARTEAKENMTEQELEWTRQVAYRFPIPPMLMRYTLALGLNGKPEKASVTLKKIYRLHGEERFEEGKGVITTLANSRYPQLKAVSF